MLCKKTVGVFLACLVLVSLLLFPSCGQNESILPTDGLPQPTDKLTLYLPPNLIDDFLTHALALFREDFPDVQIEYKTFEGQDALERITNYQSILATDLITGNGPDLVLFHSSDFSDYQKLLRAGHFVNLDDLFTQDADYSTDTFQRAVWDSGRIDGERLFAPLNYSTFVLLSSHEGMQECGISLQASTTFEEWAAAVVEYMKDHAGTADAKRLLNVSTYPLFLDRSGVNVLDYNTGQLSIQTEQFRSIMEFFHATYQDYIQEAICPKTFLTEAFADKIRSKEELFQVQDANLHFLSGILGQLESDGSVHAELYPFPVVSGQEPFARPMLCASIPNSSPNKRNAYELLKLLLSEEVQEKMTLPVNNAALKNSVSLQGSAFEYQTVYDGLTQLASKQPLAREVLEIILDTMTPWFEDRAGYDDCLASLQNKLELYLHE